MRSYGLVADYVLASLLHDGDDLVHLILNALNLR